MCDGGGCPAERFTRSSRSTARILRASQRRRRHLHRALTSVRPMSMTETPVGAGTAITVAGQEDAYKKSIGFGEAPPDPVRRWDDTIGRQCPRRRCEQCQLVRQRQGQGVPAQDLERPCHSVSP